MSEKIKTGGAAFPGNDNAYGQRFGMTLRDFFAAKIAGGDAAAADGWSNDISDEKLLARARLYYRLADAMIAVRAEGQGSEGG